MNGDRQQYLSSIHYDGAQSAGPVSTVHSGGGINQMAQILHPTERRVLRPRSSNNNYAELDPSDESDQYELESSSGSDQDPGFEARSAPFSSMCTTDVLLKRAQNPALRPTKPSKLPMYLQPNKSVSGRDGRAAGRASGSPYDVDHWDGGDYAESLRKWQERMRMMGTPLYRNSR